MNTQKEINKQLVTELKKYKAEAKKYRKGFEIEKNIKNGLYFFILTNDLLELLKQFRKTNDYQAEDYHVKSLEFLINRLP